MEIDCATGGGPRIWAISDGKQGDARQARALAQAVARRVGGSVSERTVAIRPGLDRLPAWGWDLATRLRGGPQPADWPFRGLVDAAALSGPWPAMAIGCGRRAAPFVAAMRRFGASRAVQIMSPQMRLAAFDAVVAPAHDGLTGRNVVNTLGALNDLDASVLAAEAARWRPRLGHIPTPRVAVLVGGPSGSAAFGALALETLMDGLTRLAGDGAGLMITPSRRTPRGVTERLADALSGLGGWIWGGVGDNPYPGILGLADAIVVTADSVNMASEAAATGKPVLVSAVDRLDPKHRRFHQALQRAGVSRPFAGALDRWDYQPLREAERIADGLAALLAPA
ncbi:MAG: mitochondrial fission ELM1 family protein [Rubrimonas sp.]